MAICRDCGIIIGDGGHRSGSEHCLQRQLAAAKLHLVSANAALRKAEAALAAAEVQRG